MGELKNRTKIGSTLRNDLNIELNRISDDFKANKSRLLDEAVEDLVKKYDKLRKILKT